MSGASLYLLSRPLAFVGFLVAALLARKLILPRIPQGKFKAILSTRLSDNGYLMEFLGIAIGMGSFIVIALIANWYLGH